MPNLPPQSPRPRTLKSQTTGTTSGAVFSPLFCPVQKTWGLTWVNVILAVCAYNWKWMHRCVCVCICIHITVYAYMCVYVYSYIYVYIYVCMYIYIYIYTRMYICVYVYSYVWGLFRLGPTCSRGTAQSESGISASACM